MRGLRGLLLGGWEKVWGYIVCVGGKVVHPPHPTATAPLVRRPHPTSRGLLLQVTINLRMELSGPQVCVRVFSLF